MKKIKKIIAIVMLFSAVTLLSACSVKDLLNYVYYGTFFPDLVSSPLNMTESETLEQLMATRDLVREFNVYIETSMYNIKNSFHSDETTNIGSGSIIAKNQNTYFAITNYHVVNYGSYANHSYTVETLSGKEYVGTVVKTDTTQDMAIIKFDSTETLGIANISTRTGLDVGENEFLIAVGNPSGVKHTVTYGKSLGLVNIQNVTFKVIHHNALIKPGNSGGALTDILGNFIGMNTWGTENIDTDNYAIPLSIIKPFLQQAQTSVANFPTIIK